jgi:TP901 family phage tail tape measure protein
MPNSAVTVSVNADTRQMERNIENIVRKQYTLNLETKGQPLGRITGEVGEFNKSLNAANARVIAFGASAGVILGMQKAFSSLVDSTIEVQKSLTDINVILNVSASQLEKFGGSLFQVAKNTGASFQTVAEAATELSRQGLGVEETLKRTNDALILSRLSGLGAAKSVEALTAAVNSFASQGISAAEIVNKFANVDAAFAVSSKDLAEGISRVGASAAQSGVSIDELIALVTSAQQVTARGGAVIGNSFKTIFTRLERGKTQSLLESLGVDTKDESGQIKSTIALLRDLAKVYGTLDSGKQAEVAEKVGGVFQINILKAALGDLSKEYSVYNQAVQISKTSTDEAIQRNEALNQTYAAQINALKANAMQLSANAGEKLFGPSMKRVIGGGNDILESINESDGQGVGAKLANGILAGLGQVLAGPGLALIGGVLIKLLADFSKFGAGSVKELLGLNNAAKEQKAIQESINQIVQRNPELYKLITNEAVSTTQASRALLTVLKEQTLQMERQSALSANIASQLYGSGVRMGAAGTPVVGKGKASGYIPNFADQMAERAGAAMHGYTAGRVFNRNLYDGKGGSFEATVNGAEKIKDFTSSAGHRATIVQPPNGFAGGYIPNFVETVERTRQAVDRGVIPDEFNEIGLVYAKKQGIGQGVGKFRPVGENNKYGINIKTAGLDLPNAIKPDDADLENKLGNNLVAFTNTWIGKLGGIKANKIKSVDEFANAGSFKSIIGTVFETAITQATLESNALKDNKGATGRAGGQIARIDFSSPNDSLRKLFNGLNTNQYEAKYTVNESMLNSVAEKAYGTGALNSMLARYKEKMGIAEEVVADKKESQPRKTSAVKKVPASGGAPSTLRRRASSGYIPNFADAMEESYARESMSVAENLIYTATDPALITARNPTGIAHFNYRDEPNQQARKDAIREKGPYAGMAAKGYIPNFANENVVNGGFDGASFAAIATELSSLAIIIGANKGEIATVFQQEINERKIGSSKQLSALQQFIEQEKNQLSSLKNLSDKEIAARQKLIASSEAELAQRLKATKAGVADTVGAGTKAAGGQLALAATFLGPILAQTISDSINKSTPQGRGAANAVGGAGNVVSGIATGAMIFKGVGAAAGGVITGLMALDSYLKEVNNALPEFSTKTKEASEAASRFDEVQSGLLPLVEKLQNTRDQQGGAADTKEQMAVISKINQQTASLSPELRGKIAGTGYGLDEIRDIMSSTSTGFGETKQQTAKNEKIVAIAQSNREEGLLASIGRSAAPDSAAARSTEQSMPVRLMTSLFTLGFSEIAGRQAVADKAGSIEGGMKVGRAIAGDVYSKSDGTAAGLTEMSNKFAKAAMDGSMSLYDIGKMAGLSADAIGVLAEKGIDAKEVLMELAVQGTTAAREQRKVAESVKSFKDQYGQQIQALAQFKTALSTFVNTAKLTGNNIGKENQFGFDFNQDRNVSRASAIGEMGFANESRNLSVANDVNSTITKAKFEAGNDVSSKITELLLKNSSSLIPESTPTGAKGVESGKEELGKQIEQLGKFNLVGDLKDTLSKVGSVPTTSIATQFNDKTGLLDKGKIVDQFKASSTFQSTYGGPDSKESQKAIDELSNTIDTANDKLLSSQRDLASKAAVQIDQLIKVQLEQLNKVGGGIDKVLSDKGPQAGKNLETAALAYGVVQKNPQATDLQKGKEALQTGRAINELTGGIPTITTGGAIFNDTAKGISQGLQQDFKTSFDALSKTQGGDQQIAEIKSGLAQLTGKTNLQDQTDLIAKFQASKALGVKDTTGISDRMYQQQVSAAREKLASTGAGKEELAAFDKASQITLDPAALATKSLEETIKTIIGRTNSLLEGRLGKESDAGKELGKTVGIDSTKLMTSLNAPNASLDLIKQNPFVKNDSIKYDFSKTKDGQSDVGPTAQSATPLSSYEFKVGVDLAGAGDLQTSDLNLKINDAVKTAVTPILQDFYAQLQKTNYKVDNGKSAPPSSSTSQPASASESSPEGE